MNLQDARYKNFALVREMLETPQLVGDFDFHGRGRSRRGDPPGGQAVPHRRRLQPHFPGEEHDLRGADDRALRWPSATEGARQAHEYDLREFAVFGASNSGKTKELISLFTQLRPAGPRAAVRPDGQQPMHAGNRLQSRCYTLRCGKEDAVAATKSVVEQALFYRSLLGAVARRPSPHGGQSAAGGRRGAGRCSRPSSTPALVEKIAAAPVVYFAGRNNGVAEELTLKTNEITHKKSDYLEGTYAVHGIEEIMRPDEVGAGHRSVPGRGGEVQDHAGRRRGHDGASPWRSRRRSFPTIRIPRVEGYQTVLQLLAGWNILVQVGVALGINLDKAERARKIGNEFIAP